MSNEPDKIIYSMIGVSKRYDKKPVLKDIYLSYFYGAKIGVLGLNGSGKSSLLRILAGRDKEFDGETVLSPGHSVGLLEQEPELDDTKTVREIVEEGVKETVDALNEYNLINEKFAEPMSDDEMSKLIERQGEVQEKLDAETVAWLEHHLQGYPGTIIAVTHDRYFLDNVAGWILELDRGQGIPWKGNYSSWLEQKKNRLQQEEKTESERQKTLQRELEWIRMTPKGRHAKSKARTNSYEALLGQDTEKRSKELEIYIPPGPRLGDEVISADNVTKAYGDNILMEGFTFSLPPGGIVGIIGPNGAGKTTMRALEEALENFAGCAVIISHDRCFLDRIATHILAFEGDSRAVWFEGNYSEYETDRKRRLGTTADQPHRIKYRHLTRG